MTHNLHRSVWRLCGKAKDNTPAHANASVNAHNLDRYTIHMTRRLFVCFFESESIKKHVFARQVGFKMETLQKFSSWTTFLSASEEHMSTPCRNDRTHHRTTVTVRGRYVPPHEPLWLRVPPRQLTL